MTLKYYHYFDDKEDELGDNLNRPESWDVLRVRGERVNSPFYISEDRNAWIKRCLEDKVLGARAKRIAEFLKPDFQQIYSFGVGNACLEFLIKKANPSFHVHCSDFAPEGIDRLQKVFTEADEIGRFDMTQEDWKDIGPEGICLLHRVDTVFDDSQWRTVFRNMEKAKIKHILFIPSEILSLKRIVYQQIKYAIFKIRRHKMIFSGFVRTEKRFLTLLSEFYDIAQIIPIHDLKGFLLKSREN